MDERTEALLDKLESVCCAYPEDIFRPLEGDPIKHTGDYDTQAKRLLITRNSAAMGRHMIAKFLRPAVDEIERLSALVHERLEQQ